MTERVKKLKSKRPRPRAADDFAAEEFPNLLLMLLYGLVALLKLAGNISSGFTAPRSTSGPGCWLLPGCRGNPCTVCKYFTLFLLAVRWKPLQRRTLPDRFSLAAASMTLTQFRIIFSRGIPQLCLNILERRSAS